MERKPIKDITIKNYSQSFNKFMKSLNKSNIYLITNSNDVIEFIKKKYPNIGTSKTIISSILYELKKDIYKNMNILDAVNNYKLTVNDIAILVNKKYETKEKSQKEIDNWDNWNNIVSIFNNKYNEIKDILNKPVLLNYEMFNKVQTVVILSLYIYIPPRRSEYINIKLKNYDINNDNYIIQNNKIVLNKFKTSDTNDTHIINLKLNKTLNKILNEYIKLRDFNNFKSDFLFVSEKDTIMDHSQLAKRLNKLFNKKISISMLRKIYLNDVINKDNVKFIEKVIKIADDMGTSVNAVNLAYIKK